MHRQMNYYADDEGRRKAERNPERPASRVCKRQAGFVNGKPGLTRKWAYGFSRDSEILTFVKIEGERVCRGKIYV